MDGDRHHVGDHPPVGPERWRDLDDATEPAPDRQARIVETVAKELSGRARRRRNVAVPDVVGFSTPDALGILTRAGFDAVSATPDIALHDSPGDLRPAVVVRQDPDPSIPLPAGSTVRLWLERGGGEAGVREPRRPSPPPRAARAERDARTGEAVG